MTRRKIHGKSYSREYDAYLQMKRRCYDPSVAKYKIYGARGITVCDSWRESFSNFISDMGPRPTGYSIDRIDNNGPYSPENCRWATALEQGANTRQNRIITYAGRTLHLGEWARLCEVTTQTLWKRLARGRELSEYLDENCIRR